MANVAALIDKLKALSASPDASAILSPMAEIAAVVADVEARVRGEVSSQAFAKCDALHAELTCARAALVTATQQRDAALAASAGNAEKAKRFESDALASAQAAGAAKLAAAAATQRASDAEAKMRSAESAAADAVAAAIAANKRADDSANAAKAIAADCAQKLAAVAVKKEG